MADLTHAFHQTPSAPPPASASQHTGDHEHLFHLLAERGPAPEAFMLGVSDPWIECEDLFGDWGTEAGD